MHNNQSKHLGEKIMDDLEFDTVRVSKNKKIIAYYKFRTPENLGLVDYYGFHFSVIKHDDCSHDYQVGAGNDAPVYSGEDEYQKITWEEFLDGIEALNSGNEHF